MTAISYVEMITYAAVDPLLARGQEAINPRGRERRLSRECAIQWLKYMLE